MGLAERLLTEWQITSIQAGLDDLDGDSAGFGFLEGARNVAGGGSLLVDFSFEGVISAMQGSLPGSAKFSDSLCEGLEDAQLAFFKKVEQIE